MNMAKFKIPEHTYSRLARVLNAYEELRSEHEICVARLARGELAIIEPGYAIDIINELENEPHES